MKVAGNCSLKSYNTFSIEVIAEYFADVESIEELHEILSFIQKSDLKFMFLGGGSNILFRRNNFNGIVIKNSIKNIEVQEEKNHVFVKASSGVVWDELVKYCVDNEWGGIENLSLIPGTVGAAPIQNIGAYGVELKDCFFELEALHIPSKKMGKFNLEDCQFTYRDSLFKRAPRNEYFIHTVTLKMDKTPALNIKYGSVENEIAILGGKKDLKTVRQAIINIRKSKLPDPQHIGNGGSFFKNPIIPETHFSELQEKFPSIPHYPDKEGWIKVPAAWLIDQAGWKGYRSGDAGVHKDHALVLVNYGLALGEDIFRLSKRIIEDIESKFSIRLEREINVI